MLLPLLPLLLDNMNHLLDLLLDDLLLYGLVLLLDQQNRQKQLLKLSLGQLDQRLNLDLDLLVLALDLLYIRLFVLVDLEQYMDMGEVVGWLVGVIAYIISSNYVYNMRSH